MLLLALLVAVAALTAVGFLANRIGRAVELQASEVLAADLRLESPRPIDEAYDARGRAPRPRGRAHPRRCRAWCSTARTQPAGRRCAQWATGYPLRGRAEGRRRALRPGAADRRHPGARRGLAGLAPARGARRAGRRRARRSARARCRVTQRARSPARPGRRASRDLAATLLINVADLAGDEADPARQPREPRRAVRRRPRRDVAAFQRVARGAQAAAASGCRRSPTRARRSARRSDRAGRFLSLASLVACCSSAVAVAMAARRYAQRHLDSVALMKCMGASQRFVLRQTLLQLRARSRWSARSPARRSATSRRPGSRGCCAT